MSVRTVLMRAWDEGMRVNACARIEKFSCLKYMVVGVGIDGGGGGSDGGGFLLVMVFVVVVVLVVLMVFWVVFVLVMVVLVLLLWRNKNGVE